jgi:sugar-specific transcriptional regulator TrmB
MSKKYDEKGEKRIIDGLEKLGLTAKESRVYIYLMGREVEVGSSKIVTATHLHGQYVYTALTSLQNKGLVKHVVKSNRKKWSANPPSRISSLVEEKRIVANDIKDSLEKLYAKQHEQDFEVYQGVDQFVANELQMIDEAGQNSSLEIIGGQGSKFPKILGENRQLYNDKSIAKNIVIRYIGTEEQRVYLEQTKASRPNFDFRIMSGYSNSSVSTSIYTKAILLQIYGDPVLVFKIKSEDVARDYRTFFESLWELCEKQ